MAFSCDCEIEIEGGTAEERLKAAALVLAFESIDKDSASQKEIHRDGIAASLLLDLKSVDGLPEENIEVLTPQFPSLSFTLVYFSHDGEFYGYARAGGGEKAAESEDFAEDTRDIVARRHDGDRIAFVRAAYSLPTFEKI
jgi:hypothetical protein